MKHYTHFLPKKTPRMIQIGKQINALNFEIEETERKLKNYKANRLELEKTIYTNLTEYHGANALSVKLTAENKADHYNNERLIQKTT